MGDEPRDDGRRGDPLSRRDFIRGTTVGALTTGLLPAGLLGGAAEAAAPGVLGPGKIPIALIVNGAKRSLEVEPRVTLLDALRDRLSLTGAKKACDRGSCGACTVLLDGKPAYSCSVLAVEAQGRAIETVEGLGTPESLGPVQAAFVEHDALQCGFCTPGFVMACEGLLRAHPDPAPRDLEQGLGGNLCRCGTYAGIRRAVAEAAKSRRVRGA